MPGPLSGLKILDFTTLLPGPYATMHLACMGARVLRIGSASRPDMVDFVPPYLPGSDVTSAAAFLGRGKRSMALNLKDGRAVSIVRQLIQTHDIIVEQFRPGVMARLGLDYGSLRAVNPALIYCSITGYGQDGPLRDRAGHDINYLARSGLMSYSGKKSSGPALMGMQIADVAAGSLNAIAGILAAVVSRNATGKGQHVDIAMLDGAIAFNALVAAAYLVDGREPEREGFLLNGESLYDFYETSDGKHVAFGGLEPQFFNAFCAALGRPDLAAGGVAPANAGEVKKQVADIIRTKPRDEWAKIFEGADACADPVLSLSEALDDPHARERGLVVEVPREGGTTVRQPAGPIRFSETRQEYRSTGVLPGTHTIEVLRELGYADGEIAEFEREGLLR